MQSINEICEEYGIQNYTINDDGSIDVDGTVHLTRRSLTKLPLKFNYVSGSFYCYDNQLTTLEGSPKEVGVIFDCSNNKLTSLEFSPRKIDGTLVCSFNDIRDLKGCPDFIKNLSFFYETPIGSICNEMDIDFIKCFNSYRVINKGVIQLKRLKYLMDTFNMGYDLEKIKKYYAIN